MLWLVQQTKGCKRTPNTVSSCEKRKRKDYTFRRQFNEQPSIIPGCSGFVHVIHVRQPYTGSQHIAKVQGCATCEANDACNAWFFSTQSETSDGAYIGLNNTVANIPWIVLAKQWHKVRTRGPPLLALLKRHAIRSNRISNLWPMWNIYSSNACKQSATASWLAALAAVKANCHCGREFQVWIHHCITNAGSFAPLCSSWCASGWLTQNMLATSDSRSSAGPVSTMVKSCVSCCRTPTEA